MGYDAKDGKPPANHPPIVAQGGGTPKAEGTCPLGFGGEDGKPPPINPPIPEQTERCGAPPCVAVAY